MSLIGILHGLRLDLIAISFKTLKDYSSLLLPSLSLPTPLFPPNLLILRSNFGIRYSERCPNVFPGIHGTPRSATIAFSIATICASMSEVGLSCIPSPSHKFNPSKSSSGLDH
jgi:hypothetical protein